MVATLAQAASAAYYLESQRSFRHPNEYYTAGEEPDGVWFNPNGLLGLADGGRIDSADFHRLYNGFAPDSGARLTRNAGSEHRSAGLDMTFSADKSVSALWAVAGPELRSMIERAHNDAARVALEETVLRYCAWTRIRNAAGEIEVLPADIAAALFQHGTSRDNDPQLHTHCVIFNAARTHRDGKWRAMHQHPVYGWMKAAGAVYRNALAWNLRHRLGIAMEHYGREGEFTRIAGLPEELTGHWSKRRKAIIGAAREMGFTVQGNAARAAAANKITRSGKSPDNDAEVRHRRWRDEAARFVEREALIASLPGRAEEITREQLRDLTGVLEGLPERLTREEAVFRLPDMVEGVANATAGLLGRDAVAAAIERVARHGDVVRLTRAARSAEGKAGMAHTSALFHRAQPRDGAGRPGHGGASGCRYRPRAARPSDRRQGIGAPGPGLPAERGADRGNPCCGRLGRAGGHHRGRGGLGQDHHAAGPSPISTVNRGRPSSPPLSPGAPRWRSATTSMHVPSASTSCSGWRRGNRSGSAKTR